MKTLATLLLFLITIAGILLLSGIIAYGFFLLNKPFLPTLLFTFAIISFIGVLDNLSLEHKSNKANRLIELELEKIHSKNTLHVSCSYCRAENPQLINLRQEMVFNCVSCKQPNKVVLNYGSVRVTTPINTDVDLGEILPKFDLDSDSEIKQG